MRLLQVNVSTNAPLMSAATNLERVKVAALAYQIAMDAVGEAANDRESLNLRIVLVLLGNA